MAFTASSPPSAISTKPKPRDRPVSRSITTEADCTLPNWLNAVRRSSEVVLNDKFPTYKFLLIVTLCEPKSAPLTHRPPRKKRNGSTRNSSGKPGGVGRTMLSRRAALDRDRVSNSCKTECHRQRGELGPFGRTPKTKTGQRGQKQFRQNPIPIDRNRRSTLKIIRGFPCAGMVIWGLNTDSEEIFGKIPARGFSSKSGGIEATMITQSRQH